MRSELYGVPIGGDVPLVVVISCGFLCLLLVDIVHPRADASGRPCAR